MVNFSLGNQGSRYNPNEPRDWHGRWTRGGSSWENNPLRNPGAVGRAHTLLGHARAGAWQKGVLRDFALPTPAEAKRFSRLLAVWNAASDLDDDSFREHFARGLDIGPATLRRLRQAAAGSAQAQTIGQMIEASYPLTAAIKDIGGHRWPAMLEGLEDLADAAMPVHRTRRAALDHEDQPIDSERGTPSSLLRLAAFKKKVVGPGGPTIVDPRIEGPGEEPLDHEAPEQPVILHRPSPPLMPSRPPPGKGSPLRRSPFTPKLEEIYARQISEGHGFRDHGYQFGRPGRRCTRDEYRDKILSVMRDPNVEPRQLEDGQTIFYQDATNTLVVVNPKDPDCGTMFKPDDGRIYVDELK
jgi:hypothetical protein